MAYNSSKGPQQHGDIKFEGDPLETQVDFEDDFIALKTNGQQRFIVSGSFITSSIPISCSVGITASSFVGDGSGLLNLPEATVSGSARVYSSTGLETSGYLKVTGSSTFVGAATFSSTLTASQGLNLPDNKSASFGNAADFRIHHNATNTKLTNATGHILIDNQATSKDIRFILGSDSANTEAVKIRNNSDNNVWVCDAAGNVSGSGALQNVGAISSIGNISTSGSFVIGAASMSETDLEKLDGITNGTAAANKALVVDGSKNIGTLGVITAASITGSKGRFDLANGNIVFSGSIHGNGSNLTNVSATNISGAKGQFNTTNGNLIVTGSIIGTTTATLVDITGSKGRFNLSDGNLIATGTLDIGGTAQINNTLTLSGSSSEALRITKDDASAREIVFENGGADKVSIYMNSAENFFIRQEDSSKDINLRIGTTNAVVVDGSASEVVFAYDTSHTNISSSGNLKVGGSVSASADVYVTGAVSASLFIGDGTGITGISATNISGANGQFNTTNGNLIVTGTIEMNGFVVDTDGDTNLKSLRVDDGSFIGCDSDTDLMRLSANVVQVNGTVSGSNNLQFSSASFSGDVAVTGAVRGKMINVTHHAYNTTATTEKFIPWYNLSEGNAPNNGTYINQAVAPFSGRLRRVMFRPSGSQGGGTTRVTLFKASDQSGLINTDEGGVYVEHVDVTCAGTVSTNNVFNFTGSGHYSAGDAIGVSIDPQNNMVDVNVTCIWEYDVFGV